MFLVVFVMVPKKDAHILANILLDSKVCDG